MKRKVVITTIATMLIFTLLSVTVSAEFKRYKGRPSHYSHEGRKGEFFLQRIKNLKERGLITEQEEKEVVDLINDIKTYRKTIWEDDKMTKEEHESLIQKEKALRDKIKQILEKVQQQVKQEKSPQEKRQIFNERIDKALKEGKINKKDAEELKKLHEELVKLEEDIWSDNVMTKDEQKKLFKKQKEFNEKIRKVFKPSKKKHTEGKKFGRPPSPCHKDFE